MKNIDLYNGNNLEVMDKLIQDDVKIDLTVTSPPYDKLRTYKDSLIWNEDIWKNTIDRLYKITIDGGVIVWVVSDATINGSETGTSFKQALYFKEVGFNLHDTMIYHKKNPIPLTHNRYEQCFEYMFIFTKGRPKTFNPILENCKTSGSYTHRRNTGRVKESATRNRDEITITKKHKYKTNMFSYVIGSKKGDTGNHPAPFPLKLASDHIFSWSNKNDLVADLFMGSGTTGEACQNLNRKFIGIEKIEEYYNISEKRLQKNNIKIF